MPDEPGSSRKNSVADAKGGPRNWRLVVSAVLGVPTVVTVIIVVWEWLENPSGIFHDRNATNWGFVYETAVSWFVPTFQIAAGFVATTYVAWFVFGRLRGSKQ